VPETQCGLNTRATTRLANIAAPVATEKRWLNDISKINHTHLGNICQLTWHFLDNKSRTIFAHNFHASETGNALLPSRGRPSLSPSSFFGRFTGRNTSRRPTAGGAD